ncbi:hypothetical protein GCM10007424_13220 [Flavobacterium suaedae]|uniref:Uncharacterized protein n=1 Tax=Flavobacterium suaedae TaxID=1767027 RepID=A0ABQ1JT52_9FLAO|nr:hypothetical protein GCM10007424_13220 [Flavobacterium suaedae]
MSKNPIQETLSLRTKRGRKRLLLSFTRKDTIIKQLEIAIICVVILIVAYGLYSTLA